MGGDSIMRYYVNADNKVVGLMAFQSVPDGFTPTTEEEAKAIIESRKPVPKPPTLEQVYALRAAAYADPLTGSDRHFAEAARKRAEDDTAGADAATQAGLARVSEIKAEYPLP